MSQPRGLEGRKILVTGGAGFIGSNLVDRLAPHNEVTVLDNLFSGLASNLAASRERIEFIEGDVLDKELVARAVAGVEYVFHLAAHVGNVRSIENPYLDMDVNVRGTINILEACRQTRPAGMVCSCSSAIFGEAKYLPINEEHPIYPESPYAVSKLAEEKYCFAYHKVHGVPVTMLRYFNVYGPRQGSSKYANATAIFMNNIMRGEPLTVYGDGEQTRDFVFVDDVVSANILAALHPEAIGDVFNIADGRTATVNDVIALLREITGREITVNYAPAREGEVRESQGDIAKAREKLGYQPQTGLREGLLRTWRDYLEQ